MIIAIDFDGTCVAHEFPKIGAEIGDTTSDIHGDIRPDIVEQANYAAEKLAELGKEVARVS